MNDSKEKAAAFWNARTLKPLAQRVRWWQSATIHSHVNRIVCGEAIAGAHAGFHRLIDQARTGRSLRKAVSVGCGPGQKEMALMRLGFIEKFYLYEISSERIKIGRANAEKLGLSDRVIFAEADAFEVCQEDDFDLVYWNNALHHMPDTTAAVAWSHDRLAPGGIFAMDDFIGPSRFQWTDAALDFARRFRAALPAQTQLDPADLSKPLRPPTRPTVEGMIQADPSEAADSSNILPAIARIFPHARVIHTGGAIYSIGLNDQMAHFDDDGLEMRLALLLDEALALAGENHYAVAVAVMPL